MYPTVAGKIASHGPYVEVSDVYKIDNLTGEYTHAAVAAASSSPSLSRAPAKKANGTKLALISRGRSSVAAHLRRRANANLLI